MIVIYGRRAYGQVDTIEGQYAITTFAHVYFLPLVPTSSMWVLDEDGGRRRGFSIRLSGKSVLAAYGRVWGTVGGAITAVAGFAGGRLGTGLVGLAIAAASASTWRWWRVRGDEAARARLGMIALGLGCDPLRLDRAAARSLRPAAEKQWAAVAGGKTPGDLARDGGGSVEQVAAAYTLLRLIARSERGEVARRARADGERLLAAPEVSKLAGAPYRDRLASEADSGALVAEAREV